MTAARSARQPGRAGTRVGIRSMRERAQSTGGDLDARPIPDGGFRVRVAWQALNGPDMMRQCQLARD